MPDTENDTDSENEGYSPAQVAASHSESVESVNLRKDLILMIHNSPKTSTSN